MASIESGHSELYKSRYKHEEKQSVRREKLLAEQRSRRAGAVDEGRCLEEVHEIVRRKLHHPKRPRCDIKLQNSEWFWDIPNDTSEWYVKPCPKGFRALVVAAGGKTLVYNKNGKFIRGFRSSLPGDQCNQKKAITILDCVFVPSAKVYYVMDVIAYGTQDLRECEAEFRSFWIESRFDETDVSKVTASNDFAFRLVCRYECSSSDELNRLVSTYPPNYNINTTSDSETAELDGYLFYHKESWYTHGKTPLVGWLFPFMLPEFFSVPFINDKYLVDRPANYTSFRAYFKEFDESKLIKKQSRRRHNGLQQMEAEVCEQNEYDEHEMDDNEPHATQNLVEDMAILESGLN